MINFNLKMIKGFQSLLEENIKAYQEKPEFTDPVLTTSSGQEIPLPQVNTFLLCYLNATESIDI